LAHATIGRRARRKMPLRVAREIVSKMHGKKMSSLPEKAKG